MGDDNQQERIALSKLINKHFNLSEIKSLCFDLDIKFDDLGGEQSLELKVQELISYCDRRLFLYELVEELKKQRPKVVDWPHIPQQTEPVSFIPEIGANDSDAIKSTLPTGFKDLDKLVGGLRRATLIVVMARPDMGKSSFVTTLAQVVALRYKQPVMFFSLQFNNSQLRERLLAMSTRIGLQRLALTDLSEHQLEIYREAEKRLSEAPLYLNDDLQITFLKMEKECKRRSIERNLGLSKYSKGL